MISDWDEIGWLAARVAARKDVGWLNSETAALRTFSQSAATSLSIQSKARSRALRCVSLRRCFQVNDLPTSSFFLHYLPPPLVSPLLTLSLVFSHKAGACGHHYHLYIAAYTLQKQGHDERR